MSKQLESVDVLIIGAGLSGIGSACQLRRHCPHRTFAIFESRSGMGGTWDLFRYPGIRSDSDMYTFSYGFKPWRDSSSVADGAKIRRYIQETAAEYDVRRRLRCPAPGRPRLTDPVGERDQRRSGCREPRPRPSDPRDDR